MQNLQNIFIIAGEASGDLHAAAVITELKKLSPALQISGIGGTAMQNAGAKILIDAKNLAVMGLFEILAHLTVIYSALQTVKYYLKQQKPNLIILVDYAGFNLRVAKIAKQLNIPVLYFISPKIWAWHSSRVYKIAKLVDTMAVILPFEVEFYKERVALDVRYVGNPLVDCVKTTFNKEQAYDYFNLNANYPIIGLLPGSRKMEINRLLPILLQTAELLKKRYPNIQFILPIASTISPTLLANHLKSHKLTIRIVANKTYEAMQICQAMAVASGTATLEAMILNVPLTIVYKISPLSYLLRFLVKIKYIGLGNIIANEEVAKELIQANANPQTIFAELCQLLEDQPYRQAVLIKLSGIRQLLGEEGAARRVAKIAKKMLDREATQP